MLNKVVRTAQHARHIGADRHFVAPDLPGLEHRVERRDFVDLDRRQVEVFGNRVHLLGRHVTLILVLHGVQRTDDRRALPILRETRLPAVDFVLDVRRKVRSSSVNLTKHDVLRADDGDHVGKHVPFHHLRHG